MIRLSATKAELTITETETITSGAQRVFECTFTVNGDWDGLNRTAVFRAGTKAVPVLLGDDNTAEIPWEVLQTAGITLRIGLYGTNAAGDVLPTVWADAGMICTGAYLGDDAYPPTPGAYEQLVEIAENAEKIAQSVRDDADAGAFDGPPGKDGAPGEAATIAVGTVTTGTPETPADVTNTGTENAAVFDFVIPQGPPGKDAPQIDDTAVSSAETWSSRKIIDTLCPEFSVSGNPVTCTPVEGYPLSAVVMLEPKQAGSGDPSPENVRPISGRDEVTVNVRGKNLLDPDNVSAVTGGFGFTVTYVGNNTVHITGQPNNSRPGTRAFNVLKVNDDSLSGKGFAISAFNVSGNLTATSAYGLTTPSDYAIAIMAYLDNTVTYDARIQIAVSEEELEAYEPYQPGTTATLTLPETIYGGTVDAVTGVGSKTWGFIASYNGEAIPGEWISVRDVYAPGTTPTTGAQVAYKLAAPEPFQATGNQPIPALAGENTVYTDGNSLAVSGRSDPTAYIQQQISDAITAAVAITGGT